ncbi:hypothetical protein MKW94_001283 [Papaver nudicaule]|uniref:Uncharacterized protein n=1 Tax=Papaver nudicaule TaxID=74823 RepID=A0AA41V287_PAPNU|nr:hypothetical protein [Papaver nudicaule]
MDISAGTIDKLKRTCSCDQLPHAEHKSDLSIQFHKEEEEVDKEIFKSAMRSMLADIIHTPSRKDVDPNTIGEILRKLELSPDQRNESRCQDSYDDSDEEFHIPTQNHWRKICLSIWEMEVDDAVISQVKTSKQVFNVYIDGWYSDDVDSGCGAILHESCHRPIVATSKVISKEKCVSPFCLQLEGVALGVKLAKKYHAFPFKVFCSSEVVCSFFMENWACMNKCRCSGQLVIVEKDHKYHEKAFELCNDIFSDISALQNFGHGFEVRKGRSERNEAAYHVAELKKDSELKLKEICELKELWGLIYKEAFGIYFE